MYNILRTRDTAVRRGSAATRSFGDSTWSLTLESRLLLPLHPSGGEGG